MDVAMTEGRSGAGVFAVRLIQIAVLLAVVLLVWRLSGVLILFFASLLLAIAFAAIAQGFMKLLPIPRRMAVGLSVLALIGSLGAVVGLYGWRIAGQYDEIYAKALQGARRP